MREPVFLLALAIAAGTVLMVVKTIAAAFNKTGSASELAKVKEQLQLHAAMLDDAENNLANQSNQIAELQERLDFTERLLTQGRERTALGPGENKQG